ncbi:MAG: hypothetical protein H0W25_11095 [Acidimicrobiia bacterium]|nr:hypothetical protein [Acidimicrobiia bacterium]
MLRKGPARQLDHGPDGDDGQRSPEPGPPAEGHAGGDEGGGEEDGRPAEGEAEPIGQAAGEDVVRRHPELGGERDPGRDEHDAPAEHAQPLRPGRQLVRPADLTLGRYLVFCPLPGSDGTPHAQRGQVAERRRRARTAGARPWALRA